MKQGKISVKHLSTEKMLPDFFTKPLQGSKFKISIRVIMGWDDVATLWYDSNDKDKVSSTSKEHVEFTGDNVYADDGHKDGNAGNVDHRYTDMHVDTCTWSDVVIRGTTGGRNMCICTS